jgi:hypothetical protein
MNQFYPVIHHNNDGTSIFRNDLVEVTFDVDGEEVRMTFDLETVTPPVLPFCLSGRLTRTHRNLARFFAVDSVGKAWVESKARDMMVPVSEMVTYVLLSEHDLPLGEAYSKLLDSLRDDQPDD